MKTDLIIIGAGASGMMAAVTAAEQGLRTVLIERKTKPGRKILLCGNNRCNLSSSKTVDGMVEAYGEPVGEFLRPALDAFSSEELLAWFEGKGLPVSVHKDGRIFPASEKADDVLHVFTDALRANDVPLIYNSPVTGVTSTEEGYCVETDSLEIECEHLLIATGGVSYPKTGSVGDGQKIARSLGHKVVPYRPGLVGFVMKESWLHDHAGSSFMGAKVDIIVKGREVASTFGEILCNSWGLSGPAMVNASRIIARQNLRDYEFVIDLKPELSEAELLQLLAGRVEKRGGRCSLSDILANAFVPKAMCRDFISRVLKLDAGLMVTAGGGADLKKIVTKLKSWRLVSTSTRPLKEAMVTVGGVELGSVDSQTMQSKICSNLYFAGEVLDVDGPTGGFNLHAAFATARLVISSISESELKPIVRAAPMRSGKSHSRQRGRRSRRR